MLIEKVPQAPEVMSTSGEQAPPSTSEPSIGRLRSSTERLFAFPDPVNEVSARLVAAGVVLMCVTEMGFDQPWLAAVIAYGFLARVLTGPTLSPLGQLVTRVLTPRVHVAPRPVPGPPKRFAQGIGAALSLPAAILALAFAEPTPARVLLGAIAVAATLESVFGLCLGCRLFAALMRVGVVPAEVCKRCATGSLPSGLRPGDDAAGLSRAPLDRQLPT
jgi:uncharacterized protein DUF4395